MIPHSWESLREAITNGECWVARFEGREGEVVGFATFGRFLHGHGFLRVVAVHPNHRRQSVGAALVAHLERICPTDKLFTATTQSNVSMQRFAERLGFERSGVLEHIEENEPELVYVKRRAASAARKKLEGDGGMA